MARIRTIKPEFFTSEDIVELDALTRLFYISLWCEADREGRLKWKPGTLKLRYFPADSCDVEQMGKDLEGRGLIELYEVDGSNYAEIPGFKSHQVINNRESDSILPENSKNAHASFTRESGVQGEGRKGKEGKGRSICAAQESAPPEEDETVATISTNRGEEYPVTKTHVLELVELYPMVDINLELKKMKKWCDDNKRRRKTKAGMRKFIHGWLGRAQNDSGRVVQHPAQQGRRLQEIEL